MTEVASREDGPEIGINVVDGKTEHDRSYGSIIEAAEAAICSIHDYLENELPTQRTKKEQRVLAEQEWNDRIQDQVNDFLGK